MAYTLFRYVQRAKRGPLELSEESGPRSAQRGETYTTEQEAIEAAERAKAETHDIYVVREPGGTEVYATDPLPDDDA